MSLIYVGRLDELKGVRILFKAWRLMGANAPQLVVCGSGSLEDWCKGEAVDLNIKMMGFVDNDEAKRLIGQSNALILPTLWYEGFPMTILEAYSVGTPVICSDLGNAGAVVEEGVTGWKFETGSAEALARAVIHWKDIREGVKKEYITKYASEANYKSLKSIYDKVCCL